MYSFCIYIRLRRVMYCIFGYMFLLVGVFIGRCFYVRIYIYLLFFRLFRGGFGVFLVSFIIGW